MNGIFAQIESMQGQRLLTGMWHHFYEELAEAYNAGKFSESEYRYLSRLLLKVY